MTKMWGISIKIMFLIYPLQNSLFLYSTQRIKRQHFCFRKIVATPPIPKGDYIQLSKISCYMTELANDHQYLCITIFAPFQKSRMWWPVSPYSIKMLVFIVFIESFYFELYLCIYIFNYFGVVTFISL